MIRSRFHNGVQEVQCRKVTFINLGAIVNQEKYIYYYT